MNSPNTFEPVEFHCYEKIGRRMEHWDGTVTRLINHGSHYEIYISSRSGFSLIAGKYTNGRFMSIPSFEVASDLADFDDYFWNNERPRLIMNRVDAATVAEALRTLNVQKYI